MNRGNGISISNMSWDSVKEENFSWQNLVQLSSINAWDVTLQKRKAHIWMLIRD